MSCNVATTANSLNTELLSGTNFVFPNIDVNDPIFDIPEVIPEVFDPLTNADLTTAVVNGSGIFDTLMKSISAHMLAEYKANRKVARDKSTFDFATFFPILDTFLEDLKSTFTNIHFLKIESCEGDDIIGHLSKYYNDQEIPSIIVSTDRDMNQLLKYKLVKQYDPAKKKMFEVLNPAVELECKIIMGDKGDNIPAIKPKCGPATATALIKKDFIHDIRIMEDKIEAGIISPNVLSEEQTLNREYLKNYYRNQELIDLSFIPQDIKTTIETELNNYPLEKFNSRKVLNLLVKHRMAGFIDTISELTATMNKIG